MHWKLWAKHREIDLKYRKKTKSWDCMWFHGYFQLHWNLPILWIIQRLCNHELGWSELVCMAVSIVGHSCCNCLCGWALLLWQRVTMSASVVAVFDVVAQCSLGRYRRALKHRILPHPSPASTLIPQQRKLMATVMIPACQFLRHRCDIWITDGLACWDDN